MASVWISLISIILFIVLSVNGVEGTSHNHKGEWCYHNSTNNKEYCDHGCCGDSPNEYCCENYAWIIHLAVWGGIFVIGLSITFCVACVIWCKRPKRVEGQVILAPGAQPSMLAPGPPPYTVTAPGMQYPYAPPPAYAPQAYSNAAFAPSGYSQFPAASTSVPEKDARGMP